MSEFNGSKHSSPQELLVYWINERYRIYKQKSLSQPKPWSDDPVFQTTYFCNVHRENDKVTKWIRDFYKPYHAHPMLTYNYVLARFLNRPTTLKCIGFVEEHDRDRIFAGMDKALELHGKIWGGAYVITTHGLPMGKAAYMVDRVLPPLSKPLPAATYWPPMGQHTPTLAASHAALMRLEGLGSFLAAQIVADLKNTTKHPLSYASDWWEFVAPGPGSLRGASWFHYGEIGKVTSANFKKHFDDIRDYVDTHVDSMFVPYICSQDLQNCLCEFDKYMRVKNGTGRSKRSYNGRDV